MQPENKKTVVLGASDNARRYSNMAIQELRAHGHPVVAIGKRKSMVAGVPVQMDPATEDGVDTVTLYLNPQNQKAYYNYILSLHPNRIIFNPGAENAELEQLARDNHIKTQEACTLVLLKTGQY